MNRITSLFKKGTNKIVNKGAQEDIDRGLPELQRLIASAISAIERPVSKVNQLVRIADSADLGDYHHQLLEVRDALEAAKESVYDADREMP